MILPPIAGPPRRADRTRTGPPAGGQPARRARLTFSDSLVSRVCRRRASRSVGCRRRRSRTSIPRKPGIARTNRPPPPLRRYTRFSRSGERAGGRHSLPPPLTVSRIFVFFRIFFVSIALSPLVNPVRRCCASECTRLLMCVCVRIR